MRESSSATEAQFGAALYASSTGTYAMVDETLGVSVMGYRGERRTPALRALPGGLRHLLYASARTFCTPSAKVDV